MSIKKFATSLLSIGALSTVLLAGAPATSAAPLDRDDWNRGRVSESSSYARGYRDGFRAGYRDGREDGRDSRRSRSLRRPDGRSSYDRGFAAAYERGYRQGLDSVRHRDRDHDWDNDHRDGRRDW